MKTTHWEKTFLFTALLAIITILTVLVVQLKGDDNLPINCSYLDPVTVDFLAFAAALFLVIEGFYRLHEHKYASFQKQITRAIRIAFGFAIITLHSIQFLHK